MSKKPTDVDLIIPMIPEMELTASTTAEAVGKFMRLESDQIDEIKIALIEACINSFEHSQSPDRRVNINFEISSNQLSIQISDEGQGFDLDDVRSEIQGRRDRNEKRGWGLKIMQELMDEVRVESGGKGTNITMVKYR
jgi:serine/threonine-protein kinase RsbW